MTPHQTPDSKDSPLVSVVISAYNAEPFIRETLDGLLHQTYENFEIIAVDDCSTDATGDILDEYALKDRRIRVIHNPHNLKAATSKNIGIDAAKGKYVAINDADDISLPQRIEEQVKVLEEHPEYSFVSCLVRCFYDDSSPTGVGAYSTVENLENFHFNFMSADGDLGKTFDLINKANIITNRFCHSSMMGKASVYKLLKYKMIFAEDWELWNRALLNNYKITKVPEVLLRYRIVNSGMCGVFGQQESPKMLAELKLLHKLILKSAFETRNYLFISRFIYAHNISPLLHKAHVIVKNKIIRLLLSHYVQSRAKNFILFLRKKLPKSALNLLLSYARRVNASSFIVRRHTPSLILSKIISLLNGEATAPITKLEKIDGLEAKYNIGIWTIEEKWLMGGLHTILQMAIHLIKKGKPVRFINYGIQSQKLVDDFYLGLHHHFDLSKEELSLIEIVNFQTFKARYTECNPDDRFIAGFWFPAEDIQKINKNSGHFRRSKYGYIIQDYEPHMLYRWGSDYARSYNTFLDHNYYPIFNNSQFVCGYIKKLGLINEWAPYQMLHGEPCKTEPPTRERMVQLNSRIRLLFYSRPSVDKNIYDIKIEAIKLFIDELERSNIVSLKSVIVTGIGETAPSQTHKGVVINNLGKLSYKEYPSFIQNYNIGLVGIVSPAFAYPCIEFPRAGLVTVSNRFETRDLEKYSANIISSDTSAESICEKLLEAVSKIHDVDTRIAASTFQLPGVGITEATNKLIEFLDNQ